jgi:hypothetical protein
VQLSTTRRTLLPASGVSLAVALDSGSCETYSACELHIDQCTPNRTCASHGASSTCGSCSAGFENRSGRCIGEYLCCGSSYVECVFLLVCVIQTLASSLFVYAYMFVECYTCTYTCICMYVCMSIYVCIYIYIYLIILAYIVCVCVHVNTHAHTHTLYSSTHKQLLWCIHMHSNHTWRSYQQLVHGRCAYITTYKHVHTHTQTDADVDECATNLHACSNHALCSNILGGYTCKCHPSYSGNGTHCAPAADAHKHTCSALVYTPRWRCSCAGDLTTCVDIDECSALASAACHVRARWERCFRHVFGFELTSWLTLVGLVC